MRSWRDRTPGATPMFALMVCTIPSWKLLNKMPMAWKWDEKKDFKTNEFTPCHRELTVWWILCTVSSWKLKKKCLWRGNKMKKPQEQRIYALPSGLDCNDLFWAGRWTYLDEVDTVVRKSASVSISGAGRHPVTAAAVLGFSGSWAEIGRRAAPPPPERSVTRSHQEATPADGITLRHRSYSGNQ